MTDRAPLPPRDFDGAVGWYRARLVPPRDPDAAREWWRRAATLRNGIGRGAPTLLRAMVEALAQAGAVATTVRVDELVGNADPVEVASRLGRAWTKEG